MVVLIEILLYPFFVILKLLWVLPVRIKFLFKKPKVCPPIQDDILFTPAGDLVKKICKREVSCHWVIEKYIKRIKEVNPVINAVVEERFAQALEEAILVDNFVSTNNFSAEQMEADYPLLGVPLTVKESIAVKGMSNAAGCLNARGKKAENDADIVFAAKKAGAIVLVVSNTPELCLNWESNNKITGTTNNPYNTTRTSGGSSGGEGALLGSGGSLIGFGSDIAGSLRLPAHYCGIFSHKPTPGVVSIIGHYPSSPEMDKWILYFTVGPMARYASDLNIMFKVITNTKPELRETLKLNEKVLIENIKIFYLHSNGCLLSQNVDSVITNRIKQVIDYFQTFYNVETIAMKKNFFENSAALSFMSLLGINDVEDFYFDKPKTNIFLEFIKYMFGFSKATFGGIMQIMLHKITKCLFSTATLAKVDDKNVQKRKELEEILGDDGVLFYPVFPTVAPTQFTTLPHVFNVSYLSVFNSLGLPVTHCPIGFDSNGMPFGLQIVTKRNCDRISLALAQEIEQFFGGWKPPGNKIVEN